MDKARKRKAAHTGQPFGGQTLASGINDKYIYTHTDTYIYINILLAEHCSTYFSYTKYVCLWSVVQGDPPMSN